MVEVLLMALNNQKNFVIAAVVLLLAAVGAAAWIHNSGGHPLAAPVAVTDASTAYAPVGQPYAQGQQPYAGSYAAAPAAETGDGYYPIVQRPAYIRQPEPQHAGAQDQDQDTDGQYIQGGTPEYRTYREHHHGRSKKHSIEIVAGTAAAGAAIGAIAGGGKGAAIGGISGAGAGFAYDRLTHNH